MVSKARSKNMKERMAYVRSFRRKKTKGGSIFKKIRKGVAFAVHPVGYLTRKAINKIEDKKYGKGGKLHIGRIVKNAVNKTKNYLVNKIKSKARSLNWRNNDLPRHRELPGGWVERLEKIDAAGGRFPSGGIAYWKAHASEPKYKRAIANWNKMMANNKFASSWNSNKKRVIKRGGAFTTGMLKPLDYSQLMQQYERYPLDKVGLKGGAMPGLGYSDVINSIKKVVGTKRGSGIRAAGIRAAGIRAAGIRAAGIRAAGYRRKRKQCKGRKCRKRGGGVRKQTKSDLYKGGGNSSGVFYSKVKSQRRKLKIVPNDPATDLMNGYRELYKNSGIKRENPVFFDYKRSIPPNVVPMRPHKMKLRKIEAAGGDKRSSKKGGRFISGGKFFKKLVKTAGKAADRAAKDAKFFGKLVVGKKVGRGLTEEAGIDGRGHPDYIYH